MLPATALALLSYMRQDVLNRRLLFKTKPAAESTKGNHHPLFLQPSELGRRKLSMQLKFVAAQKMLLNRNRQTFVNGLLGFITLGIYTRWKRVCIAHTGMSCLSIRVTYLHCSLIYFWVPSSCFCIVISLSLRVK